jgi:hypothetical protein
VSAWQPPANYSAPIDELDGKFCLKRTTKEGKKEFATKAPRHQEMRNPRKIKKGTVEQTVEGNECFHHSLDHPRLLFVFLGALVSWW